MSHETPGLNLFEFAVNSMNNEWDAAPHPRAPVLSCTKLSVVTPLLIILCYPDVHPHVHADSQGKIHALVSYL